jgi:hypothetical protein
MALQMSDLRLRLRVPPSSFNDALRTMDDAAHHIEALERGVRRLQARIEALEAALKKITGLVDSETGEPLDDAIEIARAALDKDIGQ